MSLEAANGLVARYGASIGLPGMRLDDEGYCGLSFSEERSLHMQYAPEDEALLVYAKVGAFDEDAAEAAMTAVCMANLFWIGVPGVTVSALPQTGEVFVSSRTPVVVLDEARFAALLDRMMDESEAWANRLEALNAGEALPGPRGPSAPPPPGISGGPGMLRA